MIELHKKNICHLDIKEANILLCRDNANKNNTLAAQVPVFAKLADFGIAQRVKKSSAKIQKKAGTRCYMAREQFLGKKYSPFKADVFALGVLLFKLIYKAYPPS